MVNGFNQNHSGSGDHIINVGKQPYVLTEAEARRVLSEILPETRIELVTVGDERMGHALASFLTSNGIVFNRWVRAGSFDTYPPLNGPLTVTKDGRVTVVLDSTI